MNITVNSTVPQPDLHHAAPTAHAALDRPALHEVTQLTPADPSGASVPLSWREISARVARQLAAPAQPRSDGAGGVAARAGQLSELLKLQVEVSRYQLRVEMLAKVAESGVASLRRLQQPQ